MKLFIILLFLILTKSFLIQIADINNFKSQYKYCSELSKEVYDIKPDIINVKSDTQLKIQSFNNSLYICFRGTSSFLDWKTNLNFKLSKYTKNNEEFKLHSGYYNSYMSIKLPLINYLKNYSYDNIYITGHSLGGSLATICSFDLIDHSDFINKNITCITFGAPRIGNKQFMKLYRKYNISIHRIVISSDPVPKLPLNSEYVHVSSSIYFKNKKSYIRPVKIYIAIKRLIIYLCNFDYNIKKHNIEEYIKLFL